SPALVGSEAGAQMPPRLRVVLHVVELIRRRLPNLDQGIPYRVPVLRRDRSFDDKRWAILLAQQNRVATLELPLPPRIERAEHCRIGQSRSGRVVHSVDQHRNPEDIGEQDELLAVLGAHLASLSEKLDRVSPLLVTERRLAEDRMQVPDQHLHHLAHARVRRGGNASDNILRELGEDKVAAWFGVWHREWHL